MALLAIDVGNTQTALGLFDGTDLVEYRRAATEPARTGDELGVLLRNLLDLDGLEGIILASSVPQLLRAYEEVADGIGAEILILSPGTRTGMPIRYENPAEVGADRIVNAVAAVHRFGAPVLVLDFGTATTFDVVSAKGEYLGGVIAPGLGISAEALFVRAARLMRVDVKKPDRIIGRTTEESVQAGLFHGYVALVEGLVRRLRAELGVEAPVVATGGLATVFQAELSFLAAVDPHLTLQGLRLLWDKNHR